ncbi:MAG: hypothetical protein ACP5IL_17035 [Syntrophobacteraceae bacterium]
MDIDYLKSHFQKINTKELIRIIYFTKDSYADETIKEAISELKRRGDYKKEVLVPIADEIKKETRDAKNELDEKLNKPFSNVVIIFMIVWSMIIGILQYYSSSYWRTAAAALLLILVLVPMTGKRYLKYLGICLGITTVVFWIMVWLFH